MTNMAQRVSCYFLDPTKDAPNSRFPVLHYRSALPRPLTEESAVKFLRDNGWEHRGTWGHVGIRHFHPNSHECYAVLRGSSTLLLGQISDGQGIEVGLGEGDVVVLPAGVAHSSLHSSKDYLYVGVYPQGCPRWRNEIGKRPPEEFRQVIRDVDMPTTDPVYGKGGALTRLWLKEILAKL